MNRLLKELTLAVLVLVITACSSHKSTKNSNEYAMNTDTGIGIDTNGNNSDEYAILNVQELQQKNVVYFDLDKYDIRPEFSQILDDHANFLRSNLSYKVTIEGHADERGTPEYNIALGERRANAVKMYLQGKGVPTDQISIVSYGKEKPAIQGHYEEAYAKNRRALLVY